MGETPEDITLNSDAVSLREWIAKHSDHLDEGIHELRQVLTSQHELIVTLAKQLADTAEEVSAIHAQVSDVHDELEAAKPMIERWQHSRIRKLATGQMPWAGTNG